MSSTAQRRARPIIPPMERRVRQVWMVLHIVGSVGWLGVILAAIALSVAGVTTDDLDRASSLYTAMEVLATTFFLPGTLLLVVTGVVLGLGTKWGLLKWWWVAVKLVIGLALFAAGAFNLRFAVYDAAEKAGAREPLESSVDISLLGMLGVMAALGVVAALLSVLKPWGRISRRPSVTAKPALREVREATS